MLEYIYISDLTSDARMLEQSRKYASFFIPREVFQEVLKKKKLHEARLSSLAVTTMYMSPYRSSSSSSPEPSLKHPPAPFSFWESPPEKKNLKNCGLPAYWSSGLDIFATMGREITRWYEKGRCSAFGECFSFLFCPLSRVSYGARLESWKSKVENFRLYHLMPFF